MAMIDVSGIPNDTVALLDKVVKKVIRIQEIIGS